MEYPKTKRKDGCLAICIGVWRMAMRWKMWAIRPRISKLTTLSGSIELTNAYNSVKDSANTIGTPWMYQPHSTNQHGPLLSPFLLRLSPMNSASPKKDIISISLSLSYSSRLQCLSGTSMAYSTGFSSTHLLPLISLFADCGGVCMSYCNLQSLCVYTLCTVYRNPLDWVQDFLTLFFSLQKGSTLSVNWREQSGPWMPFSLNSTLTIDTMWPLWKTMNSPTLFFFFQIKNHNGSRLFPSLKSESADTPNRLFSAPIIIFISSHLRWPFQSGNWKNGMNGRRKGRRKNRYKRSQ